MPEFRCALYLGLEHAGDELRPWAQLTTGMPAALWRAPRSVAVARRLAALQACEAATLIPSTLHGAWDLGGLFDRRRDLVLVDAEVYPVLRVAATRARSRGVRVQDIGHHDPEGLERTLRGRHGRPFVLVDGLCPGCGGVAPLRAYVDVVRRRGGLLVVDDTQAVGILGGPGGAVPGWGRGGGGSLRHHGLERTRDIVLLTSLAKGLGAPVAAIGGSAASVRRYEAHAQTPVHSSPVSAAAVSALEHALAANARQGEQLRRRAADAVQHVRHGLAELGLAADGAAFPVQALASLALPAAAALHRHLLDADVRAIPQSWAGGTRGREAFILTARTRDEDVGALLAALACAPQLGLLQRRRRRMAAAA